MTIDIFSAVDMPPASVDSSTAAERERANAAAEHAWRIGLAEGKDRAVCVKLAEQAYAAALAPIATDGTIGPVVMMTPPTPREP